MANQELRIAYCEDEPIQIEYMKHLISQWESEFNITCTFSGFASAKAFLFEHPDSYPFDLLILDIDMKGMDGMELARCIRLKDKKLPILFLTNRKEYVFEGYEVNAYRYFIKPISYEKIAILFADLCKEFYKEKRYLIEKQEGEIIKINLDEVVSIEVNGHYLYLHRMDDMIKVKKSLQELTKVFGDDTNAMGKAGFISTHRSFIVNMNFVERVQKTECVMSNKEMVPISRNTYKNVNQAFIQFYKEDLR